MRKLQRALLAGGLGFAVSCIAGCGGGAGLLSGDQANRLNNQLSRVSSAVAAGHCGTAKSAAQQLVSEVASLPSSVNGTLRQNLSDGAAAVRSGAATQCHPASAPTTTTPTTSTTPTTTITTTTTTTTTAPPTHTTTTTPPPTHTTTTPTTPTTTGTTPAASGNSDGQGGAGSSGGSGGSGSGGTQNAAGGGSATIGGVNGNG